VTVFCRAVLNYVPSAGARGGRSSTEVEILDARAAELPGWTHCGFELFEHPSAVTDWTDETALATVHHPEIEELAQKLTGADVALVSSHIRRSPDDARRHHQLSPITFVHSDFAAGYDEIIRRNYRDGDRAATALVRNGVTIADLDRARRLLVLQFWRNLGPAKMDFPLAFCDARTVRPEEGRAFRVDNYAGSGTTFDALAVLSPADSSRHQWYTFPELTPGEVVAFRTYDTDLVREGKTYFTPHSAFRDPKVEVGKPPRTSIELRATCLWL
jgi:hypothetical protein